MDPEINKRLKHKAKTEKDKSTVQPTVINDVLIREYIIRYNKENSIYDQNDLPVWNLTHLALSYKNIIDIKNLDGLDKLTKLQLDNNIIMKIDNLGHLKNLRWLDLSFNLISKIENLDSLTKLTDLSLYSNHISKLEGLEPLTELNVLSIGKNRITNLDETVQYLKGLKNKLEVLKLAENPFNIVGQNDQDYKLYTIEVLKDLKYLDYELINENQRNQASAKYGETLNELENQQNADKQDDGDKEVDQELVEAKIDCTHKMIQKIIDHHTYPKEELMLFQQ